RDERVASLPELEVRPALGVVLCRVPEGGLAGTERGSGRPRLGGAGQHRGGHDDVPAVSAAPDKSPVSELPRSCYTAHAHLRRKRAALSRQSRLRTPSRITCTSTLRITPDVR